MKPAELGDEELESLQRGSTNKPQPQPQQRIPDPEPKIIERATELVNKLKGSATVQTFETTEITEQDKLSFLAHVLGNKPFVKEFILLGGQFRATFKTIDAELKSRIDNWLTSGELSKVDHFNCMLAAALSAVACGDSKPVRINVFAESAEDGGLQAYRKWMSDVNSSQYELLRRCYRKFRLELKTMLESAEDPDFWPTLSSP